MTNLSVAERRDLACAWIELQRAPQGSDAHAGLFWAHLKLDELIQNNPNDAWLTILEIAMLDDGKFNIENLGAGPLEDLLVYHGPETIAYIEAHVDDPRIRTLVQHVWKNDMSDEIWVRLRSVAERATQGVRS